MKTFFAKTRQHPFLALQIGLLALVSLGLRLWELGYSDFQGDEIKALCSVSQFSTLKQLLHYLLIQRKGPLQYMVTCAYSLFDRSFASEFAARLPFALANLIALVLFFALVYRLFSLQIAIYSTFMLAVNGIFIAFARIVQYQSFVLLTGTAGMLAVTLALQRERWRVAGLYIGFLAAAVGLLAHFDAVFVLPPLAVLVWHWCRKYRSEPGFRGLLAHLFAAAALAALPVLVFYYEYALRVGPRQTDYWVERFAGQSTNVLRVFVFYNPGPAVWLFATAILLGLTRIRFNLSWQVILAWFFPPLIFMVLVFKESNTHAYTYLLPLMIVAGVGVDALVGWTGRLLHARASRVAQAAVLVVFLILGYVSYAVLIDHRPEYPWYSKRVLGMQLQPGELVGTFGFPYTRDWTDIAAWFSTLPAHDPTVMTNEKTRVASFYLPAGAQFVYRLSKPVGKFDASRGVYVLIVAGPQSGIDKVWGWTLDKWRQRLIPLREFRGRDGEVVASVYYLTQDQIEANFH
jgi:hypothetical protein